MKLTRLTPVVAAALHIVMTSGCAWMARSSVSTAGSQTTRASSVATVSRDGRFVAFESDDATLVSGDTNALEDVFVHDNLNGTTERVSVATGGTQANGPSYNPAISGDGRFVAFESDATNLAAGDTNRVRDIFVRDRQSGTTTRVSVATGGRQANGESTMAAISDDGSLVAFQSLATNLVSGDTNKVMDVFVRDLSALTTVRVSIASDGRTEANGPSRNASVVGGSSAWVAYESDATNLFPGDTNGFTDVFLSGVSRPGVVARFGGTGGASRQPSLSPNGSFGFPVVAFESDATDLVPGDTNGTTDVFVALELGDEATHRVSVATDGTQANGASQAPSISRDGTRIAFQSAATNLVPGDTNGTWDVFVRDLDAPGQTTTRASERHAAVDVFTEANALSFRPKISQDGRYVAFESFASNLVDHDTNGTDDVFTRFAIEPTAVSVSPATGTRGATLDVTVTGSHFLFIPDPTAFFGNGVTVNSLRGGNAGSLTFNITISSSAPTGAHDVFVIDLGTGPGQAEGGAAICARCFTVQ